MSDTNLTAIQRLQEAGLLVSSRGSVGPVTHMFHIAKPTAIPGNARQVNIGSWGAENIPIDAPSADIYLWNQQWVFEVSEYIPGPGPGDFQRFFDTLDEAIDAVLDYYFGDPTAMNPQS
jgi:hypothetical protein